MIWLFSSGGIVIFLSPSLSHSLSLFLFLHLPSGLFLDSVAAINYESGQTRLRQQQNIHHEFERAFPLSIFQRWVRISYQHIGYDRRRWAVVCSVGTKGAWL